jgi:hypothetical protein
MAWNFGEQNGTVSIKVKIGGNETTETFNGELPLREALQEISAKYHLANLIVETANGDDVSPSQASVPLRDVGALVVMPKAVGASEDSEEEFISYPEDEQADY